MTKKRDYPVPMVYGLTPAGPQYTALRTAGRKLTFSERAQCEAQVRDLAHRLGCKLMMTDRYEAASLPWNPNRDLIVPKPLTDTAYMIALHELGHMATADLDEDMTHDEAVIARRIMRDETTAWEWALAELQFEPSPGAWKASFAAFTSHAQTCGPEASQVGRPLAMRFMAEMSRKDAA